MHFFFLFFSLTNKKKIKLGSHFTKNFFFHFFTNFIYFFSKFKIALSSSTRFCTHLFFTNFLNYKRCIMYLFQYFFEIKIVTYASNFIDLFFSFKYGTLLQYFMFEIIYFFDVSFFIWQIAVKALGNYVTQRKFVFFNIPFVS